MSGNVSRIKAIDNILNRKPMFAKTPEKLEQMWASNVFNLAKMQASLPKTVFKSIKNTIVTGEKLDPSVADAVATAMKDWATAKGALYYAHVFYPMTNLTAEKHDGFISVQGDGNVISEFSGKDADTICPRAFRQLSITGFHIKRLKSLNRLEKLIFAE